LPEQTAYSSHYQILMACHFLAILSKIGPIGPIGLFDLLFGILARLFPGVLRLQVPLLDDRKTTHVDSVYVSSLSNADQMRTTPSVFRF